MIKPSMIAFEFLTERKFSLTLRIEISDALRLESEETLIR